jgi:hypothetical protein
MVLLRSTLRSGFEEYGTRYYLLKSSGKIQAKTPQQEVKNGTRYYWYKIEDSD